MRSFLSQLRGLVLTRHDRRQAFRIPSSVLSALLLICNVAGAADGALKVPDHEAILIMLRSTLSALNQADLTGDYGVLNKLGSDSFRKSNPPDVLARNFSSLVMHKIDLAPVLVVAPQLDQEPMIQQNQLRIVGNVPTRPLRVLFDLRLEPSDGVWKMANLSVYLDNPSRPDGPRR